MTVNEIREKMVTMEALLKSAEDTALGKATDAYNEYYDSIGEDLVERIENLYEVYRELYDIPSNRLEFLQEFHIQHWSGDYDGVSRIVLRCDNGYGTLYIKIDEREKNVIVKAGKVSSYQDKMKQLNQLKKLYTEDLVKIESSTDSRAQHKFEQMEARINHLVNLTF